MKILILLMTSVVLLSCNSGKNIKSSDGNTPQLSAEISLTDTSEYIIYGQSFGRCRGYCHIKSIYSTKDIVTTSSSWSDTLSYPQKTKITASNLASYKQLLELVNLEDFHKLPETIGCPDCADGGASWIEISHLGKKQKVNYEFGKAPKELVALEAKIKPMAE
jgi:hypothetical protein